MHLFIEKSINIQYSYLKYGMLKQTGFSPFAFAHRIQVRMLAQSENGKLRAALVANLKSAVTASFLMLPESFSEEDLFLQIAGLSYAGNNTHSHRTNY